MTNRRHALPWLATALLLALTACSTPRQTFLHQSHRTNYALQPDEIEASQFYISSEILARNLDPATVNTPAGVIVVPVGTPGGVVEVGDDWLRVSFTAGGAGVIFTTVRDQSADSAYWLATAVEGQDGFVPVKDTKDKVLRTKAGNYEVVYGHTARLLINSDQLEALKQSRTHLQGRPPSR
ncbi:MAG: hypothetical protein JRG76_14420 [Deltaproteobacteria bacterium]|nr:hypothetical protein [Deltaproteobacteria bacterium]